VADASRSAAAKEKSAPAVKPASDTKTKKKTSSDEPEEPL
jgi:hypothetical protein